MIGIEIDQGDVVETLINAIENGQIIDMVEERRTSQLKRQSSINRVDFEALNQTELQRTDDNNKSQLKDTNLSISKN